MFYVVIGFSTVHDARREAAQIGLVEARAHMRAMHARTRSDDHLAVVAVQLVATALLALARLPVWAILCAVLGSTLLLAAGSGLDAWKRRGDLRGALRAGDE